MEGSTAAQGLEAAAVDISCSKPDAAQSSHASWRESVTQRERYSILELIVSLGGMPLLKPRCVWFWPLARLCGANGTYGSRFMMSSLFAIFMSLQSIYTLHFTRTVPESWELLVTGFRAPLSRCTHIWCVSWRHYYVMRFGCVGFPYMRSFSTSEWATHSFVFLSLSLLFNPTLTHILSVLSPQYRLLRARAHAQDEAGKMMMPMTTMMVVVII